MWYFIAILIHMSGFVKYIEYSGPVIIQLCISPQIGVIYRKITIFLLVQMNLIAVNIIFSKYFVYQGEGLKDLRNLFVNHEVKLRLAAKMVVNIAQMG
jgi:hypothetical protein